MPFQECYLSPGTMVSLIMVGRGACDGVREERVVMAEEEGGEEREVGEERVGGRRSFVEVDFTGEVTV